MHDIIKKCHGNYKEMKKFNYKLEIEILRNSTLKRLYPEGLFLRVWVSMSAKSPGSSCLLCKIITDLK